MTTTLINTMFFYVLCIIILAGSLFCLFQKNVLNAIIGASVVFLGVSGLYLTIGAAHLAGFQVILFTGAITVMMLVWTMTTKKKADEKNAFLFNLKTIATPILGCFFGVLTIPFILYRFSELNTLQTHSLIDFSVLLFKNNIFTFELIGILIFGIIIGISAIAIQKRNFKC